MSRYAIDWGLVSVSGVPSTVVQCTDHSSRRKERVLSALASLCGGVDEELDRVTVSPSGETVYLDRVEVWRGAWVPEGAGLVWRESWSRECPLGVRLQASDL